jgi:hypothetical protein
MGKITFHHGKKGNLTVHSTEEDMNNFYGSPTPHEYRLHKALIPVLIIICIICTVLITSWSGSLIVGLMAGFFIGYWITLGLFAVINWFFLRD